MGPHSRGLRGAGVFAQEHARPVPWRKRHRVQDASDHGRPEDNGSRDDEQPGSRDHALPQADRRAGGGAWDVDASGWRAQQGVAIPPARAPPRSRARAGLDDAAAGERDSARILTDTRGRTWNVAGAALATAKV